MPVCKPNADAIATRERRMTRSESGLRSQLWLCVGCHVILLRLLTSRGDNGDSDSDSDSDSGHDNDNDNNNDNDNDNDNDNGDSDYW